MPHDNCPYINELYQNWSSLVSQLESLKNRYIKEGSKEQEERFNLLKEEVKKAKEKYLSEMERVVEYDNKEIFLKDAIILEYLRERLGDFVWNSNNKRANSIHLDSRSISSNVKYFPDGLQRLFLNNAKIENPEKLKLPNGLQWLSLIGAKIENPENLNFPNGLQELYLSDAKIENPENLNFPDGLQWLGLNNAKIENPENLNFPNGLQELYLNSAKIENPEKLKLPDGLQVLYLNNAKIENPERLNLPNSLLWFSLDGAKIENPEKLRLPNSLQSLNLKGIKITKELKKMLNKYKERNSNVTIAYN